ncbi:hypothetical protein D3C78_1978290 [compost metagenome]
MLAALVRKLDGITNQIEQDLPQTHGVGQYPLRQFGSNGVIQLDATRRRQRLEASA